MDFTETEVVEVWFYGRVNAHMASEMIKTQSIIFCIAKINKKKKGKKKKKLKDQPTPGVDHVSLEQYCAMSTSYDQTGESEHAY